MKSNFSFAKNDSYITLVITGEYDKVEFLSYPQLIVEQCKKEAVDKVMVDGSGLSGTDVPTMDRFFIGEKIANELRFKVKLAVVWPKEHINRFAETVAVNRGGSMIVVDTIDAAHNWLIKQV
jgi:hypothetical protein